MIGLEPGGGKGFNRWSEPLVIVGFLENEVVDRDLTVGTNGHQRSPTVSANDKKAVVDWIPTESTTWRDLFLVGKWVFLEQFSEPPPTTRRQ